MRHLILLILSILILNFTACDQHPSPKPVALFDYILPQASYAVKVNKPQAILAQNPVIIDAYLSFSDKSFLSKAGFKTPYLINILQNNSKIKGFVAVGNIKNMDSLFNGRITVYEQDTIYSTLYKKSNFYATVLKGTGFISNQKLFIENCIRDQESFGVLVQNPVFKKGLASLDNNATLNIIVLTDRLKPDLYFNSSLKIKWQDTGTWQFLDLVETDKQIASGISLNKDSIGVLNDIFESVKPVAQDFSHLEPFALDESITLSFDDFEQFVNNLNRHKIYAPQQAVEGKKMLSGLKALAFFKENANRAIILKMSDLSEINVYNYEKIKSINSYEIYKFPYNKLIDSYFSNILPAVSTKFFTIIDDYLLLTGSQSYLEKILNDIQNHATLSQSKTFQALKSEIPDNYHLILFKNKLKIRDKKYMKVQTFKVESGMVFTNLALKSFMADKGQALVEQVLSYDLSELPKTDPQLVFNHNTKTYNIIYQDEKSRLNLIDLKGKTLWQTDLKGDIIGKIWQVDLFRNHKLQYTFVTPHHWYVIDRLGRKVEKFPEYFLQKITQGISVFDYEHNRKYRFGITQSDKFKLFDNQARKVKGFKVKTKGDIANPPQHFRIGNKDFIQMTDTDGKLYLLNRRGQERIKVSKTFETTRNRWGIFNRKFVNIDDKDRLIAIDLSGKIKTGKVDLAEHILSEIKHGTLAAVADNKLLIDKKIIDLDLGTYTRPHIYKAGNKILIFIANTDNNKIYAFDKTGKPQKNFPIIGQKILDFKYAKDARYLLVYDSAHNLIVYKF